MPQRASCKFDSLLERGKLASPLQLCRKKVVAHHPDTNKGNQRGEAGYKLSPPLHWLLPFSSCCTTEALSHQVEVYRSMCPAAAAGLCVCAMNGRTALKRIPVTLIP